MLTKRQTSLSLFIYVLQLDRTCRSETELLVSIGKSDLHKMLLFVPFADHDLLYFDSSHPWLSSNLSIMSGPESSSFGKVMSSSKSKVCYAYSLTSDSAQLKKERGSSDQKRALFQSQNRILGIRWPAKRDQKR